jgi:hypothetical protein
VREKLERHGALQSQIFGFVHDTHAAAAEMGNDPIVREGLAFHGPGSESGS